MCVSQKEGRAIKEKDIVKTPLKRFIFQSVVPKGEKKINIYNIYKGTNNNTITRWEGERERCKIK